MISHIQRIKVAVVAGNARRCKLGNALRQNSGNVFIPRSKINLCRTHKCRTSAFRQGTENFIQHGSGFLRRYIAGNADNQIATHQMIPHIFQQFFAGNGSYISGLAQRIAPIRMGPEQSLSRRQSQNPFRTLLLLFQQ